MKYLIKDTANDKFYCVPMTDTDRYNEPTSGPNDFPFWSNDEDEACNFDSELAAKNEFDMNCLPETANVVTVQ